MLRAVIDIGTHSVLLMIADISSGTAVPVIDTARVSRLGNGLDTSGKILRTNLDNTAEIIIDYLKLCEEHKVHEVYMIGTEVFRRAENASDAIKYIFERTGVPVSVISPEREAELSFVSALPSGRQGEAFLVFDIGGGSTEFAYGTEDKLAFSRSIPLGCVSLTGKYLKNDPPAQHELELLRKAFGAELETLPDIPQDSKAIGVAGTVTTAASMLLELPEWNADIVEGFLLTPDYTADLLKRVTDVGLQERKTLTGLQPERADVIIAGVLMIEQVLKRYNLNETQVSVKGLRYAIAADPGFNKEEEQHGTEK